MLVLMLIGLKTDKVVFASSPVSAGHKNTAVRISYDRLREAMDLSAAYLTKYCNGKGKFLYRVNVNPDIPVKPRYNFVRHAGTIYALATYDQLYPQDTTKNALKRATAFLKKSSIAPMPEREDLLAVWSHPEITGSRKPLQAKLGGSGLGLVALLSVENVIPGTTPVEYLRKMGNFILFMQKPDGSFYSKYIPEKGGKDDTWVSLYYPGEAALGLLMLYEKDRSLKWLQGAADSIAYLARKREGKKQVEADHWALLATSRLLPLYHLCRQSLPKKAIERHAIQICESILQSIPINNRNISYFGCFTNDGRTTPTAIRLEGLLAAIRYLPKEYANLRKRMISVANDGLLFLLRAQFRSGPYTGGIPRAIKKLSENHPQFSRSFNRRATEIRIDYVQHALSAMILYTQIFF
jgi:hypothetical protein